VAWDVVPVRDGVGRPAGRVCVGRDVTDERRGAGERVRLARAVAAMSDRDELTGLLNARGFAHIAEHAARVAARLRRTDAVVWVRVDGLALAYAEHGAPAADDAVCSVAEALRGVVRDSDVIARVAPGAFVVYAVGTGTPGHGEAAAARVRAALDLANARAGAAGRAFDAVCTVRVAEREPGDDVEALLRRRRRARGARRREREGRRWPTPPSGARRRPTAPGPTRRAPPPPPPARSPSSAHRPHGPRRRVRPRRGLAVRALAATRPPRRPRPPAPHGVAGDARPGGRRRRVAGARVSRRSGGRQHRRPRQHAIRGRAPRDGGAVAAGGAPARLLFVAGGGILDAAPGAPVPGLRQDQPTFPAVFRLVSAEHRRAWEAGARHRRRVDGRVHGRHRPRRAHRAVPPPGGPDARRRPPHLDRGPGRFPPRRAGRGPVRAAARRTRVLTPA
jgi:diguanylate cyclase (GGDEF)-like protein